MARCTRCRTALTEPWPVASTVSFLSAGPLADNLATLLGAQDLSRLCAVSSALWRSASHFSARGAEEHHGMRILGGRLADLYTLQCLPSSARFSFRLDDGDNDNPIDERVVLKGRPFCRIRVGGTSFFVRAQSPAQGNRWSIPILLQRGDYSVNITGWRNPYQGILDLFLDGARITDMQGIDWSTHRGATLMYTAILPVVKLSWTGAHQLMGEVFRTNSMQVESIDPMNAYWMCLQSLHFVRHGRGGAV